MNMETTVTGIFNLAPVTVQVLARSPSRVAFDIVLGSLERVWYVPLLEATLPLAEVRDAGEFEWYRVMMRIGNEFYSVFRQGEITRMVPGHSYVKNAPAISGWSSPGSIMLAAQFRGGPSAMPT
jgi:hypothetical protein